MGDVNLEIKLSNLDERVIKIEESGGGSGGDGYITSVSNDFNVVNKKLSLSNDVTTKLSNIDNKIDKPTSATEGQVLTYRNNEWVADDSQGGGQFVIIAKGKAYEGQTVTATKGTKSKSAVITSGVARISVDEGGVWTLTLSSGETLNTPNMIYYGEYEVSFVPKGSTVTPTDDIQIWFKCADLNKSYTTMSEVLADTNTLSALISDNNASDYLVRSTTWASDVCNNESAMIYIGLNDYCANKLLADSTWFEAICSSPHFEKVLTVKVPTLDKDNSLVFSSTDYSNEYAKWKAFNGNNLTSGWLPANGDTDVYVGYEFTNPVIINKVVYFLYRNATFMTFTGKTIKVKATNDNSKPISEWQELFTINGDVITDTEYDKKINNNTAYKYYAFNHNNSNNGGGWHIQFYGREEV